MTIRIRVLLHTNYYYTFTITARPLLLQMRRYYTFKVHSLDDQPVTDYGYWRSLGDCYTATMTVLHIFNNHTNKTYKNDTNKKGWPCSDQRCCY